jgi:hypothetical protein
LLTLLSFWVLAGLPGLRTLIHLHAFELLQREEQFASKKFRVKVAAKN